MASTQIAEEGSDDATYNSDDLNCIKGTYFTPESEEYVPLTKRTPTNGVERDLKGVKGVVDVLTVGYRYWHVTVTDEADADEIRTILSDRFGSCSLPNCNEDNRRYVPGDTTLVYEV